MTRTVLSFLAGLMLSFAVIGGQCLAADPVEEDRPSALLAGSFGVGVTALAFSVDTWIELSLDYGGFGLESLTSFALGPTLTGGSLLHAAYVREWIELGTIVGISLVPYAFQNGTGYLDLTIADLASEDPFTQTLLAIVSFELSWFPTLAPSIEADVQTTLGPLFTSVFGRAGVVPFAWQECWLETVVSFLDATIGEKTPALLLGGLTARIDLAPALETDLLLALGCRIGALATEATTAVALYPALTAWEELAAEIRIDAWSFAVSTLVDFLPYGFREQRIAVMYASDHFQANAAVVFGQAGVTLDAGFDVSFP